MFQHLKERWLGVRNAMAKRRKSHLDTLDDNDRMLRDLGLIRYDVHDVHARIRRLDLPF
ncbi:hypothetical protein [Roseibium sp. MMSF_3544]|uniref:hypothetical protein n=1 Tax=unclassified Roseibium TaxID=2629323 RepID=UPI00273F8B80|nr:hypothetical protein [Roseibium sp. MMSF_3544]